MSRHQKRRARLEQAAAEKARARAWPGDLVRITLTPHAADIAPDWSAAVPASVASEGSAYGHQPRGSSPEEHSAALESPDSVKFAERHQTDQRPTAERALESPNWSGRRCRRGHPLAGQ